MKIDKKSLLVALFGMGLILGTGTSAYAQQQGGGGQQGQPPQQQQGGQAAEDIDEKSLNKFKDAFAEVNSIRESFAGKLEDVEDPEKAQKLQQEAQEEMVSAVEDAGLSVEEYNQIFAAVQQNPELQEKVLGEQ
ncbi:MAG: DUF4168 domain-containing protein [Thiohalophilus sp.]